MSINIPYIKEEGINNGLKLTPEIECNDSIERKTIIEGESKTINRNRFINKTLVIQATTEDIVNRNISEYTKLNMYPIKFKQMQFNFSNTEQIININKDTVLNNVSISKVGFTPIENEFGGLTAIFTTPPSSEKW